MMCNRYSDGTDFDAGYQMGDDEFFGRLDDANRIGASAMGYMRDEFGNNAISVSEEASIMRSARGVRKSNADNSLWNEGDSVAKVTLLDEEGDGIADSVAYGRNLALGLSQGMRALIFFVDEDESDPDFIMEFKEWVDASRKIYEYSGGDDGWAVENLPLKDFALECIGDSGDRFDVAMRGCLFHDSVGEGRYIILIQKQS